MTATQQPQSDTGLAKLIPSVSESNEEHVLNTILDNSSMLDDVKASPGRGGDAKPVIDSLIPDPAKRSDTAGTVGEYVVFQVRNMIEARGMYSILEACRRHAIADNRHDLRICIERAMAQLQASSLKSLAAGLIIDAMNPAAESA